MENYAYKEETRYLMDNIKKGKKIVRLKAKINKDNEFAEIHKGDIIELYSIPYKENLQNLINIIRNPIILIKQIGIKVYIKSIRKQLNKELFNNYYHCVGNRFPFILNEKDIEFIK